MPRLTSPQLRSALLLATLAVGLPGASLAQGTGNALPYSRSYLLTGNYVVGAVDLTEKANPIGSTGFSTGKIPIQDVPADADIVAAYLYWETITTSSNLSQAAGARFRGTEILLNDVMAVKKSSTPLTGSTAGCWSSGVPLTLTHFRADVLRLLPIRLDADDKPTGKRLVNTADLTAHGLAEHSVTLPARNGNQVPESAGASLVIVYRDPDEPLRKVVFYDGLHVQPSVNAAMTQTLQGFYRSAADPQARLTHIAASGQPNGSERLFFNGANALANDPFVGGSASQRWWGSTTYLVGDRMTGTSSSAAFGETATTRVDHSGRGGRTGGYDCLTWSAVVFSTAVADADRDGLPDGIEDAAAGMSDPPSTAFPDGQPLPNLRAMGASSAQQDLFIEFNGMRTLVAKTHGSAAAPYPNSPTPTKSVPAHVHMPTPADLRLLGDLYASRGIVPHFDVGDWSAYRGLGVIVHNEDWTDDYTSGAADQYLVPSSLARGGELMDERACSAASPTCQFPAYPGTVSWKVGFQIYRDAPVSEDGDELLTPAQVAAWQLGERRRRFDVDRKGLFHYVLNAHARGKPRSTLPCLVSGQPAPYDAGNGTACTTRNPEFHIPSSASGVADLPGGNAMVTLGFWDENVGTPFVRTSTTFHEVGHNLNLWHGGRPAIWGNRALGTSTVIEPNCKPTYQSAMSYLFQVHGLFDDADNAHLDLSGAQSAPVSETGTLSDTTLSPMTSYRPVWYAPALSPLAIDQGSPEATRFCSGQRFGATPPAAMARVRSPRSDAPIDWNGDLLNNNAIAHQDVNFDATVDASLEGFDDWANLRLDQNGVGRHAVKFQGGDFLDYGSGDFVDYGSGDFVDYGSGDFVDYGSGDFVDYGSGVLYNHESGDFVDYGSGDFVDFGSGDFIDYGSGDFLDYGSGSERQELDFEFAASLGRGPAYHFSTCIIGQDADCSPANPFTPTYHHIEVKWWAPTFGSVFTYHVSRKRGDVSSPYAYAAVGTSPTGMFGDGELPNGVQFTYRTRTEFDDEATHTFSGYSLPITETAVNHAPVANNDSFASPRSGLRVTARAAGVLANDTDVDSPAASIRAVLVTGPQHGGVVLNADGTFKYTPVSGYTGPDSFTYRTNNGTWSADSTVPMSPNSNIATVTIVVGP